MSLRKQLTLALLLLALLPSTFVSILALRQVHQVNQLWESAGTEEALTSSVSVAKQSLRRLEDDLDYFSGYLVQQWRDRAPDLRADARQRHDISRLLDDLGFSFVQIYARDPQGYHLESAAYPESARVRHVDLSQEIAQHEPGSGALHSSTGALAVVRNLPGGRRVAIGHLLAPDFFLRLSELQLGLGTYRALAVYARVFRTYLMVVMTLILLAVAGLAVGAAYWISRRLAGPVTELSASLAGMDPGAIEAVPVPRHATPEIRRLGEVIHKLTKELRDHQVKLASAERAVGSGLVARRVAHEIRNPLATLGLALGRLDRQLARLPDAERSAVREVLDAMRQEFEMLDEMAETFALLGRTAEPLVRQPVDLNRVAESVGALHGKDVVGLELDLQDGLPLVTGDERTLRRVLTNLVKNALEAQEPDGRVLVRTRTDRGAVVLEVSDRGTGMPPEQVRRAFEPGYSTKEGGSGLGLFLVRSIVEQHGGAIVLESSPGRGTTARVRLPATGAGRSAA